MRGAQCACPPRHAGSASRTQALMTILDTRQAAEPAALGSCGRRPGVTTGSRCGCRCSLRGAYVRPTSPQRILHGHQGTKNFETCCCILSVPELDVHITLAVAARRERLLVERNTFL